MQQRLLDYVEKIAQILGKKMKFGIYDEDDIRQEIFLLVYQGQTLYDSTKGDEFSFFFHFVKNRLNTLKRDKYYNPKVVGNEDLKKMIFAQEVNENSKTYENSDIENIDMSDSMKVIVDGKIPANMRLNYLRLLDGVEINWHEKNRLIIAIKNIIRANEDKQKK